MNEKDRDRWLRMEADLMKERHAALNGLKNWSQEPAPSEPPFFGLRREPRTLRPAPHVPWWTECRLRLTKAWRALWTPSWDEVR